MTIVLDTNVLVSGLLSPFGPPGHIVRLVAAEEITLHLDARILAEYADVLARPRFAFDPDRVVALLNSIVFRGRAIVGEPLAARLPDPDDEPILEVAIAGGVRYLVTGNLAHFPEPSRQGVSVISPAEFVEMLRRPSTD